MRSTLELVAARLTEFDPSVYTHLVRPDALDLLRLCRVDALPENPAADDLYFIQSTCLPPEMPEAEILNLICLDRGGCPDWVLNDPNCNSILLRGAADETQVTAAISSLLEDQKRFFRALNKIVDALYYGQGLQAVVDIGSELFGNPMFIIDSSLRSLAMPRSFPVRNPKIRADMEKACVDENAFLFLKEQRWFEELRKNGSVAFFPPEAYRDYVEGAPTYEFCYCYVKVNGVVAAYINIFGENGPLLEHHRDWVVKLAQLVSIELQKSKAFITGHGAMYEALLTDLLEGRITDQLVILRRLALLDRKLEKYLHVITIRKFSTAAAAVPMSEIEQDRLRAMFPNSSSVAYKGDVVLLISSADGSIPMQEDMDELRQRFAESGLVAGISNIFQDPTEMARFYRQSVKALDFGKNIFSSGGVYQYPDYTVYHALELCTQHVDLRDLCHPGILLLEESDSPADRDLFQTLYLYLLYMKDVNRVCLALNIHRSTLFYRLNKLKSVLGVDLDDGNTWFRLMFSFKLIEYMDIFFPTESHLPK